MIEMFNLNNAKPEKLDIEEQEYQIEQDELNIEEQEYLIEQDELDIKRQNI